MGPRLLRLLFGMGQQCVKLLDHRLDLERQRIGHPVAPGGADARDRPAHPAQRAEAIPGLQSGHQEQADAEHGERPGQDRANAGDLVVELVARTGDDELPSGIAARQADRAFDHPQRFARKLPRIVIVRLAVLAVGLRPQPAVPQRARGQILVPRAADLPVEAAVRLKKALIAERAVEIDLAVRVRFRPSRSWR